MKTLREFLDFTKIRGNLLKFTLVLLAASFLYCMLYSMAAVFVYQSDTAVFYIMNYIIVIWAAYVFMIILFQFQMKKRRDEKKLSLKTYFLPLWKMQTMLFIIMAGFGYLSFTLMLNEAYQVNSYLVTPVIIVIMMLYLPLQILSFLQIYDGKQNPLLIIKDSFLMILKHYRSCFYSLLFIVLIAVLYQGCMSVFFDITASLSPASAVVDLMIRSNPLMDAFTYVTIVSGQTQLIWPLLISLAYGIVMCIALVFYYMFMICVYDEDINL